MENPINTVSTENIQKIDRRKTMPHLFKKGQSGHPQGRKKGSRSVMTILKHELEKSIPEQKVSYAKALVKKILHAAIVEGNDSMIKLIVAHTDPINQKIDVGLDKESLNDLTKYFKSLAKSKVTNDPRGPTSV